MSDDTPLLRAMACIPAWRLAKADAARLRYQRRQIRLVRLAEEREKQRGQMLNDPIARALAKAKMSAEINGKTK
jgi:hypothetical protein